MATKSKGLFMGVIIGAIVGAVLLYAGLNFTGGGGILGSIGNILNSIMNSVDGITNCNAWTCFNSFYLGPIVGAVIGGWIGYSASSGY